MATPSVQASNTTNGPPSSPTASSVSALASAPKPRRCVTTFTMSWDATGSVSFLFRTLRKLTRKNKNMPANYNAGTFENCVGNDALVPRTPSSTQSHIFPAFQWVSTAPAHGTRVQTPHQPHTPRPPARVARPFRRSLCHLLFGVVRMVLRGGMRTRLSLVLPLHLEGFTRDFLALGRKLLNRHAIY